MQMQICPRCGKETEYEVAACKYCGKLLPKGEGLIDEKPAGFRLGVVWAWLAIVYGVFSAFWFLMPTVLGVENIMGLSIGQTIISVLYIPAGISVLNRKKYGLYMAFVLVFIGIIGGLGKLLTKGDPALILMSLVLGPLWFTYFYRRRHWFK